MTDMVFKVVLNEGKDHSEDFDTNIDQNCMFHCENRTKAMKKECADLSKNHQNGSHFRILATTFKFRWYLGFFFFT